MATDLEKQAKELYAAFNAHDLEKLLPFFTDDVFFEDVIADGAVGHSKEEYRAHLKRAFAAFPDLKFELTSFFASNDRLCEEGVMSGTHKGDWLGLVATGKTASFRGVVVRELREDKTSRLSWYCDLASLMRQLGVLPANPQK